MFEHLLAPIISGLLVGVLLEIWAAWRRRKRRRSRAPQQAQTSSPVSSRDASFSTRAFLERLQAYVLRAPAAIFLGAIGTIIVDGIVERAGYPMIVRGSPIFFFVWTVLVIAIWFILYWLDSE